MFLLFIRASYKQVTSKLHKDFAIFLAYKKEREKKSRIFLYIITYMSPLSPGDIFVPGGI